MTIPETISLLFSIGALLVNVYTLGVICKLRIELKGRTYFLPRADEDIPSDDDIDPHFGVPVPRLFTRFNVPTPPPAPPPPPKHDLKTSMPPVKEPKKG